MYRQQKHCKICLENTVSNNIPCKCSLCLHCLVNWFEEKNSDTAIHQLKCPLNCNYNYTREELLNMCHAENQQEKIVNILFKEYLKSNDIRPCPSANCQYYGFVNENKCEDDLICAKCKYTWKDPSLFPLHMLLEFQIISSINNIGNFLFCLFHTFPCPGCGILISKNGGCPHMTCKKCNHQFCWNCKGNWIRHDKVACGSVFVINAGFIVFFIGNIFWSLSFFQYFLYLIKPIGYLIYVVFVNFVFLGLIVGTIHTIYLLFFQSKRKPLYSFMLGILETIGLAIIYFIAVWVNEYLDFTIYAYVYILLAEFIIFLIILSIIFHEISRYILGSILFLIICYCYIFEGFCLFFSILPLFKFRKNPIAIVIHLLPYVLYYHFCETDSLADQYLPYIFGVDSAISILSCFYKRGRR